MSSLHLALLAAASLGSVSFGAPGPSGPPIPSSSMDSAGGWGGSGFPCLPGVASPAGRQEDEREDVRELLGELDEHVGRKGEADEAAIGVLDRLLVLYPELGSKDRRAIVEAAAECVTVRRTRELEPGVADERLHLAAAVALGEMAPESVEALVDLLRERRLRRNLEVRAEIARSLGKTRDPRGVDPLLDLLGEDEPELIGAAATALALQRKAPQEMRKEIFEEVLERFLEEREALEKEGEDDPAAQRRWAALSGPMIEALQRLSGHQERAAAAWSAWWEENRESDWDAI